MRIQQFLGKSCAAILAAIVFAMGAQAGPIIVAGTDADDHGFFNGIDNVDGWLFMQLALQNVAGDVSNGNMLAVCLGCQVGGPAEAAFNSAVDQGIGTGGWSRVSLSGVAEVTGFFDGTGATVIGDAGIIYLPTDDNNVFLGLTNAVVQVINANAGALQAFSVGGGGFFSQDESFIADGYGWLTTLVPGLVVNTCGFATSCNDGVLNITALGNAAFPGLTDADVSNGTPWHAFYTGALGGLSILVTGPGGPFGGALTNQAVVIGTSSRIGGGGGFDNVPEPATLTLLGLGLAGIGLTRRRRKA